MGRKPELIAHQVREAIKRRDHDRETLSGNRTILQRFAQHDFTV
jgi:hypothetical protein